MSKGVATSTDNKTLSDVAENTEKIKNSLNKQISDLIALTTSFGKVQELLNTSLSSLEGKSLEVKENLDNHSLQLQELKPVVGNVEQISKRITTLAKKLIEGVNLLETSLIRSTQDIKSSITDNENKFIEWFSFTLLRKKIKAPTLLKITFILLLINNLAVLFIIFVLFNK